MFSVTGIVMTVLIAVALAVFANSVWVRIQLLSAGRSVVRWDSVWKRIDAMLLYAVGQKRMFKDPAPGLMHALIFWGFLILLLRSISLIGSAFTADMTWSVFFFSEPLSHAYTLLKDLTEVAVTCMILLAYYRRWVIKPARIKQSRDAEFILAMILSLMITDFLLDGAHILHWADPSLAATPTGLEVAGEVPYAIVGNAVAWVYAQLGMDSGTAFVVFHVFFWLHIGILLFFLNYLPHSKHMHVITAVPNVFLRNLKPGYPLETPSNLEAEFEKPEPVIGAAKIEHFTWKQMLDLLTCTECGRCSVNCPAHLTGKPLNPRQLTEDLKHHLYHEEGRLLANVRKQRAASAAAASSGSSEAEAAEAAPSERDLMTDANPEAVWACTTCRSCEENCPVFIEYVDKVVALRRNATMMQSEFPKELGTCFKNLENKSNPWGMPMGQRADWVQDAKDSAGNPIPVPIMAELSEEERSQLDFLWFVGCAGSFDDRARRVTLAMARILHKAGIRYAILGTEEGCTGDTARRLGNEYLYQTMAAANIEVFNGYGVKRIMVTCPHCYQTLANEYPDLGGRYEVIHHGVLLKQLLDERRITLTGESKTLFTVHDSCYLGRYNGIYEPLRDIVHAVQGTEIREVERSRENGMCCGAGGGLFWREEAGSERMNRLRVDQLVSSGASRIAAACPFCLVMLRDGIADRGKEEEVKALDLAEIVAQNLAD